MFRRREPDLIHKTDIFRSGYDYTALFETKVSADLI